MARFTQLTNDEMRRNERRWRWAAFISFGLFMGAVGWLIAAPLRGWFGG